MVGDRFLVTNVSQRLGTVVAVQANFYQVRLDSLENDPRQLPQLLLCTRRTRLKKIGQQVMVGDRVTVEEIDSSSGRGAIAGVLPRQTLLSRPPVANADQLLLVFALAEPSLDPWQLSRFLLKGESTGLALCLCLNKLDLIDEAQQYQWQQRLEKWGYQSIFVSVAANKGLDSLLEQLHHQITILAGPSGVGKSSLINCLIPDVQQRVKTVSGKLQKGRHTTRHVELFELPGGGLLADTPGFNQPDLDCTPFELASYFPEVRHRIGQCQFNDCLHREEPHCAVRGDWERYEHYRKFLDEAIARQTTLQQSSDPETVLKLKVKGSGKQHYEPKLESKKYRRISRRERHQTLHELYDQQSPNELSDED